ncbi:MAG: redox-sensing transcriptional repressor Rex [Deltaproteobacteria bacterium]|nr:redox-sensing transcriptional repressor Rex [Deltaproteobacteria bacterium]
MSKIPIAVTIRLPLYYEYLSNMKNQGAKWVSSNMIASSLGLTPSTIRQDIKYLGKINSSSYGYSTDNFCYVLEKVLGISYGANMALVGVGSLGLALVRYKGFRQNNFIIKALFDKRPGLIDAVVENVVVYSVGRLSEIVKREKINIGIITTPADVAQQVANQLIDAKIRGIWNFAPINLRVPESVSLENVTLCPSLFSLAFKMKSMPSR